MTSLSLHMIQDRSSFHAVCDLLKSHESTHDIPFLYSHQMQAVLKEKGTQKSILPFVLRMRVIARVVLICTHAHIKMETDVGCSPNLLETAAKFYLDS